MSELEAQGARHREGVGEHAGDEASLSLQRCVSEPPSHEILESLRLRLAVDVAVDDSGRLI